MVGTYTFELIPESGALENLSSSAWQKVQFHLREFQAAKKIAIRHEPDRIRVVAYGERGDGIAPGVLTSVEALVRTRLHLTTPGGLTRAEFVSRLPEQVPESCTQIEEHFVDNGELLIHLLLPDLLRLSVESFGSGQVGTSRRLLEAIDGALRCGDWPLVNAVCVSFVEHAGFGEDESVAFVKTWPAALKDELDRSRTTFGDRSL